MDRHPDDMELKNMVESYLQRLGGDEEGGSITMTTIVIIKRTIYVLQHVKDHLTEHD